MELSVGNNCLGQPGVEGEDVLCEKDKASSEWARNPLFRGRDRMVADSARSTAWLDQESCCPPSSLNLEKLKLKEDPPVAKLGNAEANALAGWKERLRAEAERNEISPATSELGICGEISPEHDSGDSSGDELGRGHVREDSDVVLCRAADVEGKGRGLMHIAEQIRNSTPAVGSVGTSLANPESRLTLLSGKWVVSWDRTRELKSLCRVLDISKAVMKSSMEKYLKVELGSRHFRTKTRILGLLSAKLPLSGETVEIPRWDDTAGSIQIHSETKYNAMLSISTWEHPLAGTRRENYEVSPCGRELIVTTYITRRDGEFCRVRWIFLRVR
ncbi:hypothetical protein BSKO_12438 [Bryopsis sp. KO-2023]|nr:hypothetical protein BSKO_12438 [Bryopsis sp. KO-2023]